MQTAQTYIDLHVHSNFSADADYPPEQIIEMFAAAGIKIMAIADHNCVRGVHRAADAANKLGIKCIPAGEFDCTCEGINLHVLGLNINTDSEDFAQIENSINEQELENSQTRLALTNKLGFELTRSTMDAAAPDGIYTGELFAELLLSDPRYKDNELLLPYRAGNARSANPFVNFYWDFYSQGKPCATPLMVPDVQKMAQIITKNGGVPVLAHPNINLGKRTELLETIARCGIRGVEAYSSYHTSEVAEFYAERAQQLGLFCTCGSDFHGKTKPSITPGLHGGHAVQQAIERSLREAGILS